MSSAGKSFQQFLRVLFLREEQHPYSHRVRHNARITREMDLLPERLAAWEAEGGPLRPDKTLTEVAAALAVSPGALHHYFQEKVGEDFRTWRTKKRIESAKRLLLEEPDTPAFLIGERVGYSDRSNFTRNFRQITGLTPAQWRKHYSE